MKVFGQGLKNKSTFDAAEYKGIRAATAIVNYGLELAEKGGDEPEIHEVWK